jgi:hypothetical protein
MTQNPGKPTPDQPPPPAHTYGDAVKLLQDDGVHEELERLRGEVTRLAAAEQARLRAAAEAKAAAAYADVEAAKVTARTSDDRTYNSAGLRLVRSAP